MIRIFISILLCFCLGTTCYQAQAQSENTDSVLSILRAGDKQGKVDTVLLKKIRPLLRRNAMTDSAVQQIVEEADHYRTGVDEDMSFSICYLIFQALTNRDRDTAINFGKSLLHRIEKSKSPEKKYFIYAILGDLRNPYRNSTRLAEGIQLYNNYLIRFRELNDSSGMATCHFVLGGFYRAIGLFDRAIYYNRKSMAYLDSSQQTGTTYFGSRKAEGRNVWVNNMGVLPEYYGLKGDPDSAIKYAWLYLKLDRRNNNKDHPYAFQRLAQSYLRANRLDSALYFVLQAHDASDAATQWVLPVIFQTWSVLELRKGNYRKADSLLVECWKLVRKMNVSAYSAAGITHPDYYRALIYAAQKNYAEAAGFLRSDIVRVRNLRDELLRDYKLLAEVYEELGDIGKSKEYYKAFISLQDSLLKDQNKYGTISYEAEQQMNDKELSISQLKNKNKIASLTRNFSLGMIALVLLLAGVVYYRYKVKQKANAVLEKTLANLRAAQSQLIQSEKMASLGELTAGIAHEIQNPLNFVNNFSEVSQELLDEMKAELDKGDTEEAKTIADNVKQNLEKILHHGKRADGIVKGMLQHSSAGSGKKEPTDINALADEYLRLAYHGLRAKDKSFNATMKTDFDKTIGNISIIPQDIGRVILNLITNAFYVVNEREKLTANSQQLKASSYQPTVWVSTKKEGNQVLISVRDNGPGIPQKILDKIFQPFFTTKPTGQGTGLGLSLSYDIVKAHGGELSVRTPLEKVETKEGVGAEFTITLPFKTIE